MREEEPTMNVKTFGPVDERSLKQLERCMEAGDAEFGALCADHHPGYSQPIGGAVAYEGYVSPSGVGYDIGCGNKAARTELTRDDLDVLGGVEPIRREITRRISFGMGVAAQERVDHPVLDQIREADFAPQRKLSQLAGSQLGTVGSGNHCVNLMEDEEGHIWVGIHFGSRGFGHKTASGFLALAQGLPFDARASEGEMDSPPVLFETGSELGESYVAAMQLAGDYAHAGRDVVVAKVLEILGAEATHEVHNHHNFAWREEHFGRDYWVIRKGCTPANPGQEGFVRRQEGVDRGAAQARSRRLAGGAGASSRGGDRGAGRRRGRGAGGLQAPARRPRRTRRLDPRQAHAPAARRRNGRPRRVRPVQGLRAARAALRRSALPCCALSSKTDRQLTSPGARSPTRTRPRSVRFGRGAPSPTRASPDRPPRRAFARVARAGRARAHGRTSKASSARPRRRRAPRRSRRGTPRRAARPRRARLQSGRNRGGQRRYRL